MVGLVRLATLSERVAVGTSILLLPLYPPALVAKQIADLDRATDGRVMLGVGIGGEYAQEFRAVQVPIEERGRRTNEMIPLLRRLWTAEEITHDGRYYPMENVKIHPAPVQPGGPPIIVAGRKEPAMRRAATLGDGWFPYMYSPRRYADSVGDHPPDRRRCRARPLGVPLVRVGVPQHQPGRRCRASKPRRRWVAPTTRTSSR